MYIFTAGMYLYYFSNMNILGWYQQDSRQGSFKPSFTYTIIKWTTKDCLKNLHIISGNQTKIYNNNKMPNQKKSTFKMVENFMRFILRPAQISSLWWHSLVLENQWPSPWFLFMKWKKKADFIFNITICLWTAW